MKKTTRIKVEQSSGNVFADLGFPNPELERLKATLMLHIHRIITARTLTQAEARKVLGIRQANMSRLMHGSTGSYSVERLIKFLTALGHDVDVVVTPTPPQPFRPPGKVPSPGAQECDAEGRGSRRRSMAKTKQARNIGPEVLDGIRQIKRGEHGRSTTVPIPAWHLEILEKRLADLAANPKAGRSWDAVLARLTRRTRRL